MAIQMRYFAAAREAAGVPQEALSTPEMLTVAELRALLEGLHPALKPLWPHLRVAINQRFVPQGATDTPVPSGAEVALIPPVAGGAGRCRVLETPLSLDAVLAQVTGPGIGGVVTFTGMVRDHSRGQTVVQLDYEAYDAMAEQELERICADAERRFGARVCIHHRKGTLKVGDILVAGASWGRVRALLDDKGKNVASAGPSVPVEVLGFDSAPEAGDQFAVVENEARAREIAEFRVRRDRQAQLARAAGGRGTLEEMIKGIQEGTAKELPVLIKADVQGSAEALAGALSRLGTDKVVTRVVYSGVGGISEADMTLAKASGALIIGFNVRANPQAREIAKRDKIDIRYYSIIYKVTEDMQALMVGLLDPTYKETFIGNAQIREVFRITKVGNVAGCMITEGMVKRGAKVRLLRDNVVIHEGVLKTLRRFKDEVREVQNGYECGMAFENYDDIKVGDVIECFDVEEVKPTL